MYSKLQFHLLFCYLRRVGVSSRVTYHPRIFYRLYTLLEEACHELDVKAQLQDSQAGASYDRYISALRQQSALKEDQERLAVQVNSLEQLVTLLGITLPSAASQPAYNHLCSEVAERREKLKKVVNKQ